MDEYEYKSIMKIMDIIMKMPCSIPFLEPVDSSSEFAPNYYQKIRRPMDLGTIHGKLLTKEYKNSNEWEHDVSLIWQNTERFFGKNAFISTLSTQFKKKFMKLINDPIPNTSKEWSAVAYELQKKLDKLIKEAPPKLTKFWKKQIKINPLQKMPIERIKKLVEASNVLKSSHDAKQMFGIIHKLNPDINAYSENVTLDVDNLKPKTHWHLEWYMRKRMEEDGLEYPN